MFSISGHLFHFSLLESQNQKVDCARNDLMDCVVPTPLPWTRTVSASPGCSSPIQPGLFGGRAPFPQQCWWQRQFGSWADVSWLLLLVVSPQWGAGSAAGNGLVSSSGILSGCSLSQGFWQCWMDVSQLIPWADHPETELQSRLIYPWQRGVVHLVLSPLLPQTGTHPHTCHSWETKGSLGV